MTAVTVFSGEHFYKYRRICGDQHMSVKRALLCGQLYFPTAKELNDPFDCVPVYSFEATHDQKRQYLVNAYRDLTELSEPEIQLKVDSILNDSDSKIHTSAGHDQLAKSAAQTVRAAGIYSLSETWDSIALWSHYADGHQGVCLRFRNSDSLPFFGQAFGVQYSNKRPIVNIVLDSERERFQKMLATKSTDWTYEKEWRIISAESSGYSEFAPTLLDGVILGANISPEDERNVLEWIAARNIKTDKFRAEIHPTEFRLVLSPIT